MWVSWCDQLKVDIIQAPVTVLIDFLLTIFDQGKSYNTVNTYRSAISATIQSISGRDLGSHHLVSRFMKGIFQVNPPRPKYNDTWDVNQVTQYLRGLFPVNELTLKNLSLKLVTLLALASAQRGQTLQALNVTNMKIQEDKIIFVVSDRLKTTRPGHESVNVVFPALRDNCPLCPRLHLLEYIKRTEALRNGCTQLFISYCKPHKSVTSSTLARWIKQVLETAGIDVQKYTAHSTRSAATSKAFLNGASISDILKLGNWSNENTFSKFYKRCPPSSVSIEQMILS